MKTKAYIKLITDERSSIEFYKQKETILEKLKKLEKIEGDE